MFVYRLSVSVGIRFGITVSRANHKIFGSRKRVISVVGTRGGNIA